MPASSNPTEYRAKLCTDILNWVLQGNSCTLMGVGGVGKSNVTRQLAWSKSRAHCLGPAKSENVVGVLVDFLKYVTYDVPSFHRRFINGLMKASESDDAPIKLKQASGALRALWEKSTTSESADMVMECLDECIRLVFKQGIENIFFILDDFDKTLENAPEPALNSLRGIRDNYKGQLAYIAMLRREASRVIKSAGKDRKDYDDLLDLIAKAFAVNMLDNTDSQFAINRLVAGGTRVLDAVEREKLQVWSGGHPALMKTLYNAVSRNDVNLLSPTGQAEAAARGDVQRDCGQIWESLEAEDQQALFELVQTGNSDATKMKRLLLLGVVAPSYNGYKPFCDIFKIHIARQQQKAAAAAGATNPAGATTSPNIGAAGHNAVGESSPTQPNRLVHTDGQPHSFRHDKQSSNIEIDGRVINLDAIEYDTFMLLYANRNQPVYRAQIYEVIVKAREKIKLKFHGVPEQVVTGYMNELKQIINTPERIYIISFNHGEAYQFKED